MIQNKDIKNIFFSRRLQIETTNVHLQSSKPTDRVT